MLARVVNAQLAGRVVSRARAVAASSATHQSARPPFTPRPRASSRRARGTADRRRRRRVVVLLLRVRRDVRPPPRPRRRRNKTPPPPYGFSSAFDSGNGELVSATADVLTVRMTEEPFTEADGRRHFQWFHFRVTGNRGNNLAIVIANAGGVVLPGRLGRLQGVHLRGQEDVDARPGDVVRRRGAHDPALADAVRLRPPSRTSSRTRTRSTWDLVARACASAAPGPIVTHETLGPHARRPRDRRASVRRARGLDAGAARRGAVAGGPPPQSSRRRRRRRRGSATAE